MPMRKVLTAVALAMALGAAGCSQQPSIPTTTPEQPKGGVDCGATIVYEVDGSTGVATAQEALRRHVEWLRHAVERELVGEQSESARPSRAPELNTVSIALSTLDGRAAGNVVRTTNFSGGEVVTVDAVSADGTVAGEVVLEEAPAGFFVSIVTVELGTTPRPEECDEGEG